MVRFHLKRSLNDILGHFILIFIPIILIAFFNYLYSSGAIPVDMNNETGVVLAIGFALAFQIWGAQISTEILGQDFLTPMHDRLLSTPTNPVKIVSSILLTSIITSFLQTLVVIIFSMIILETKFVSLFSIIVVLLISVIFNQLLGTILLFLTKQVKSAVSILTLYGIVAPMMAGLYFPLPDSGFVKIMKSYLTPLSLSQTAIYGIINKNYTNIIVGLTPILIMIVVFIILLKPLSRRVVV